jgi:uncharacterized protein YfaS (alpha-2-macroglobulin family)
VLTILAALLVAATVVERAQGEADPVRVEQFTPLGTVKHVRQVTARFSEPMVPLGDPRVRDPFDVDCAEKGVGRWIDSTNWSFDFGRDLPAGVRCRFELREGLRSLSGVVVRGSRTFEFSTGGPAVIDSVPYQGSAGIDEQQAFVLFLDAEPARQTVLKSASFAVQGLPQRVEARLVVGERRAAILKSLRRRGDEPAKVIVLEAKQRFPNGARVDLVWGEGVAAKSGIATERDQVLPFVVRSQFTATLHCGRENARAACIPVTSMSIEFSAPVAWALAKEIVLSGPDGLRRSPQAPRAPLDFVNRAEFRPPFPEQAELKIDLPGGLRDDAGRVLANADRFPLAVRTADFPPLAKFSSRFGIVEWKGGAALPVTLRNLEPEVTVRSLGIAEQPVGLAGGFAALVAAMRGKVTRISAEEHDRVLPWLHRVELARRDRSVFAGAEDGRGSQQIRLPKPGGARAFEVVGIPFTAPGLYIVELESPRLGAALLGAERPMYVPAAALVTNLAVHFKWGREGSLAWVTTLDRAEPVEGAAVTVEDCSGRLLWEGATDRQGIARISALPPRAALPSCPAKEERGGFEWMDLSQTEALSSLRTGLFIIARTATDLSFVGSGWDRGIEGWRFQLPPERWSGPTIAHSILDRALLRAGDTVHMKHVLRSQVLAGFAPVPPEERPKTVSIRHLGSEEKYDQPLEWDAGGIAESSWKIPREAKLGTYQVVLATERREWPSGSFRVEQFRVPLLRAFVKPPAASQIGATELPVDLGVRYLAGGGAGGLPVVLRWQMQPATWQEVRDFEGFTFGNGGVREGLERRAAGVEEGEEGEEGDEATRESPEARAKVERMTLALDATGSARATISGLPRVDGLREVLTELEYRDPNGQIETTSATTRLWPSRWMVGVKPDSWLASREKLKAAVAVVDESGRPVSDARVEVTVLEQKLYSNRTRLIGGFYSYEHTTETRRLGTFCSGTTDARGVLGCEDRPPSEGNLILEAAATDPDGNVARAHTEVWVPGESQWWFRIEDSDRIDLLPERKAYEPGETARLQLRMPFAKATALIAVEREGVLDAWVQPLSGGEPVIELPVKAGYAPNMFVSVMAVRGRVGPVAPTALVDLGKPAFKLGVAEIRVGWRAFELRVDVAADKPSYHVRDRATVKISVATADGRPPPAGGEVALAAVDEGLLELLPNRSSDLLGAMMGRRGYGVDNATAQSQVVGKRHFGLKALPQGGGGGRQVTRELFDTLLVWQGRLPLDAAGGASVEIPLNDSLTSFRIVAVATSGVGLFGTGSTSIRSTQDLMLLSGIAPLVRGGDRIDSEFTVRNTTDREMRVSLRGDVEGTQAPLAPRELALVPGEAKIVEWPVEVPEGADQLRYRLEAAEPGGAADHLQVEQSVLPVVPVRTFQATLLRLEERAHQAVAAPAEALPGRGGVRVRLARKLGEGLAGVREWMATYPYGCLEQRVSRAVALRDEGLWRAVSAALPAHLDADGLLKYFPTMTTGSEVLSAYVLSISHASGWSLPEAVEGRVVDGLTKFVEGAVRRNSALPTADLSIRKIAALEALSRVGKADPKLLTSVTLEPNLWPTSAVIDWWSLLERVGAIPGRDPRLREAEQIVRARLNLQGTTMGFSTEGSDGLWWLMTSPDTNAVRLILLLVERHRWVEEVPRLLRGALGRQHRGAWCCTVANAWGALAIESFSAAFEEAPVDGESVATLAGAAQSLFWQGAPQGGSLFFPWPSGSAELALDHRGGGTPWVTVEAQAAIPLRRPLSSGFRLTRSFVPIEQRVKGRWSRGDSLRIRLEVEAQSDMGWVVVSDPMPAGASHLGTGLGGESALAARGGDPDERLWAAFEERAAEGFRAYYELVTKGSFVVEHALRLNQSGRFQLPPTRVEALYAPEMFGEAPNQAIEVEP